MINMHKLFMN